MIIAPLPYMTNSAAYFERIRALGWGIWLDSGEPHHNRGRYDILSAAPGKKLIADQYGCYCLQGHEKRDYNSPWIALRTEMFSESEKPGQNVVPFQTGAMGFLGYDLGRQLEQLENTIADDGQLPTMNVGIYDWAIVQDHREQKSWFTGSPRLTEDARAELLHRIQQPADSARNRGFRAGPFNSDIERDTYMRRIAAIREYIAAGDCYQVNFAQRFSAACEGDPLQAYRALRASLPSPYSAYFETGNCTVLSLSPEQFLQSDGSRVTTKPIKGTCPRGYTAAQDEALAADLQASVKNRAENLMIVDLLRNDLSKVCHSVQTTRLFDLESYANVHHLVSTVTGVLRESVGAIDLLQACFPGGSITGAPKVRAMQIIEELECNRRSVYCGSIGYIDSSGRMDTSIAIRTLLIRNDRIYTWGGGGIVYDSRPEEEYQESLTKIGLLLNTLSGGSKKS